LPSPSYRQGDAFLRPKGASAQEPEGAGSGCQGGGSPASALEKAADPETRRRIEEELDRHTCNNVQYYRRVRAVQVLEYLPGPNARGYLVELAGGGEHLSLTHESQAALWRIIQYWQW
jgi:hypothetical protein